MLLIPFLIVVQSFVVDFIFTTFQDPNDVECSRAPILVPSRIPQTPPVNGNEEDLSLVLGTMQASYYYSLYFKYVNLSNSVSLTHFCSKISNNVY